MHTEGNFWKIFQIFPARLSRGVGMEKVALLVVLCVLCVNAGVSAQKAMASMGQCVL